MPDNETKRGFRLPDLIMVLLLFILAGSIIVPSVQSIREKAKVLECSNNIRQIALGCHNCNDATGSMPPFHVPGVDPKSYFGKPGNHGSWAFFLLPFAESQQVYAQAALSMPGGTVYDVRTTLNANKVTRPPTPPFAGQVVWKYHHCPSDPTFPTDGQLSADPYGDGILQPYGACSYACNYLVFGNAEAIKLGELDYPDRYDPKASPPHSAPVNTPTLKESFPDGTSNTILFAEKLAQCNWTMAASAPAQPGGNLWGPAVDNARWAPAFAMESPWHDGTTFQHQPSRSECNVAYPSTGHANGMIVGMADGSARTLSPGISSKTFYALCTPNGNDKPGPDFTEH